MKLRLQFLALPVALPILTAAQSLTGIAPPNADLPGPGVTQTVTFSGKVMIEGGSAPPQKATVIVACADQELARVYTDGRGEFMLNVAAPGKDPIGSQATQSTSLNNCELYSELSGYSSEHLRFFGDSSTGIVRAGTIILHPLTAQQSFTVSAVSLAAPEKAKRAFQKGQEQERKGKWDAAAQCFKKAIQVYPRYALAWMELGRSQVQVNDLTGARQSFIRATNEDSRFIEAYMARARLALMQNQWSDVLDATDRILEILPDSSANFWLLNAAAHYNLGDLKDSETSALRGLHLDRRHQFPQLEYLYGLLLARRQDYKTAAEHIQVYLKLAPHASDAPVAERRMTEFEKLSESQLSAGSAPAH
jgi:tetratricopeptide (TPR) repeat protein